MPVRAVLFDLFDTLVDLRFDRIPEIEMDGRKYRATYMRLHETIVQRIPIDFEPFARAMAETDRRLVDSHYREGRELPTPTRFRALLEHLEVEDEELVASLTQVHMGTLQQTAEYLDHHPEVLRKLADRELRLGLVSNFSHTPTALAVLERAGLHDLFDEIVVSEAHGLRKPRPEIFRDTLAALGVSPEETVHVGDNLVADVGGAHGVGMRTAWLTRRVREPEDRLREHDGAAPDWILRDLGELPEVVLNSG